MRTFSMTLLVCAVALAAPPLAGAGTIDAKNATIHFIEDARVPAQEEGVLKEVSARDGQQVAKDQPLAMVDPTLVELQLNVAEAELAVAKRRSEDDVGVRYARGAAAVYEQDYRRYKEANRRIPGTVPESDVDLARLKAEEYRLQEEKSQSELIIAGLEMKVSQAKMTAAQEHIRRSTITAPWDGVVDRVVRFTGDWVMQGDPILRRIRMDKVRVTCEIDARKYSRRDIIGRPVTVRVALSGGVVETFTGQITNCSAMIDAYNNLFLAWIELDNRKRDGDWVLWPGMTAAMTIDVGP